MLVIDGKEYEVRLEEVKVGNFRLNGVEGHDVCLFLEFYDENDVNGYINLNGGFELEEDINYFINREYKGLNFEDGDHISFEVFDTKKFLDSEIESEIKFTVGDMEDDYIYVNIEVNDELINIKYDGKMKFIEI